MFLYQQKPKSGQSSTKQKKEDSSLQREDYQAQAPNKYWMTNVLAMHNNAPDEPINQATPIQKAEEEEKKLEEEGSVQMKSEPAASSNNVFMTPTIVPSKRQKQMAQRRKQEEDIRQNKPVGMSDNTYLKLSDPQESSKLVAQAKFMQYKKNQIKQLKRNKQASVQFNSKVKQFERTMVQYKIAYGSENYNALLGNYFPDLAGEQTNPPNNNAAQKKEASSPEPTNTGIENTRTKNETGLPDNLKTGVEQLSGMDISDVRVHRNSDAPAQMQAHAFTQGSDIYVAPGQEKHMAHEAWHVVQQKQGRVQPTMQMKGGVNINDDAGLEKEADDMGTKAMQMKTTSGTKTTSNPTPHSSKPLPKQNKWGIASSTVKNLSNGDLQLTQRIPFAQTISGNEQSTPEMEEEPVFIPEVVGTEKLLSSNLDSISANLNYSPSVSRSGTVGSSDFGITRSDVSLTNITVTHSAGVFTVTGDMILTITWQVHSGTGPTGQVNISSETDSDITAANYTSVASDLTPNASGRPPRRNYWAQDITERHERFHANNQRRLSFGPRMLTAIRNWLNGQTATAASDINATMLRQAINEGARVFNLLVASPSTENDAYADGKSSYQTRATAITTRGNAGNY